MLAVCAIVLTPTLTYRMGTDHGALAYMAAGILDGRWPYLQTWESDFPGLMFLQALEILALGKSIVMFRVFDLVFQLLSAYLIVRIATWVAGDLVAGLVGAVSFCLIYQGYGPWNTAQREGFGLLFVLLGFWLSFSAGRRSPWLTAAYAGLGLGCAVTIKPTLLALAAFYLPFATRLTTRKAWAVAAVAGGAIAAPAAIIAASYWLSGGLRQLYEACIEYQAIYTAILRGSDSLPMYWMHKLSQMGRNAIILSLVFAPFMLWGTNRRARAMLWLAYVGSLYAVFVQGTFAGYHYLPGLGVGSILIGVMFSDVSRRVMSGSRRRPVTRQESARLIVACVLLLAAVPFYVRRSVVNELLTLRFLKPPAPNEFHIASVFDFTEDVDAATYLRAHTEPDVPIQVWGYESLVYYLADRYAPGRFQMTTPLVIRSAEGLAPRQRLWREEFLRDVRMRPPAYVAVVRGDHWWWAPGQRTSEELLDDFPEWKRVIDTEYDLERTIGRFLIYRRADTRR